MERWKSMNPALGLDLDLGGVSLDVGHFVPKSLNPLIDRNMAKPQYAANRTKAHGSAGVLD
jgi:hypothetical protein